MLIVLGLVAAGGRFAYGRIFSIFAANPWLNGLILLVFALGVLACFWQVAQLVRSVSWIERFARRRAATAGETLPEQGAAPRLLAPLAALLGNRGPAGGAISPSAAGSIQESVATRIDEARDITRYIGNLLIFLGLLGTFYGLATTVPAVVDTIRALAPQEGETGLEVFEKLMTGLEAQLGGMATAFSSSLLGLAGSLVVGLLELFATHGQNRFYRELEEWLSGFTRLGLVAGDGEGTDQAALAGVLDQLALATLALQERAARRDEDAAAQSGALSKELAGLAERQQALDHRLGAALERLAETSATQADTLSRLAEHGFADPETRMRLRSIDVQMLALSEEVSAGRQESIAELHTDLVNLTRAVRALGPSGSE